MKTLALIFAAVLAWVCEAQSQNHVLDLDGKDSYVELPPNILNNLDEATVEAWVKWRNFPTNFGARFFSYGEMYHDTGIQTDTDGTLYFFISEGQGQVRNPGLPQRGVLGAVRTNEWYHVAAVAGRDGMKLFRATSRAGIWNRHGRHGQAHRHGCCIACRPIWTRCSLMNLMNLGWWA